MTYQFNRTDDSIIINDINPFVIGTDAMNLPGAWSDAQSFSYYDESDKESEPMSVEKSMSSICEVARTAGNDTITLCDPKPPPNCPMSRMLIPGRTIEPGMWNYYGFKKQGTKPKGSIDQVYIYMLIFILFIIIFLRK